MAGLLGMPGLPVHPCHLCTCECGNKIVIRNVCIIAIIVHFFKFGVAPSFKKSIPPLQIFCWYLPKRKMEPSNQRDLFLCLRTNFFVFLVIMCISYSSPLFTL